MSTTMSQLKLQQSIGTKAMYPELALKLSADKDNKENILENFMKSLTDDEFNFLIYNVLAKGKTLKNVRVSTTFETADEELNWIIKTMPSLEKHKEELRVNLVSYRRKFGLNT